MDYHLHMMPPVRSGSERELRKRIPRLQTSPTDSKSTGTGTSQARPPQSATTSTAGSNMKSPLSPGHQRFVLTDHVAFRYLEEDPSTTVLARRQKLEGYEVYLVEQWACSRTHPTFIITTYTGDPKDTVWASVLSVPTDESTWSPQLRIYFQALGEYHARRKETSMGTLMITNLSSFPSSLTIIPVPDGDMKKHRELFFVNENLKRLGCSGRLGIKLAPPSSATQAKFHQLYRTSDKIPLNSAVIELVKLCQVALVIFGKLQAEYADGLLCDVTEKAVNDWWVEFGTEHYNVEPHDGILGPTTVSGLLGMLMGARNRLSAYNAPVAKDVFDIDSTKRGIAYFQKTLRMPKTRRLDRQTLEKLRRATAKAASKEGWAVPRAFKSTVAELGGKGGEMVMGMVGAGDKAGIADIETVDIDRFVELVQGERSKWLWHGKPRKSTSGDMFDRLPGEDGSKSPEDQQSTAMKLLKRESTLEGYSLTKRDTGPEDVKRTSDVIGNSDEKERDPNSKRAAIKRATGKIESGTGFTRIKDVVGRRGHQVKPSRDENGLVYTKSDLASLQQGDGLATSHSQSQIEHGYFRPVASGSSAERALTRVDTSFTNELTETPRESSATALVGPGDATPGIGYEDTIHPPSIIEPSDLDVSKPPTVDNSIAGSIYRGVDLDSKLPFSTEATSIPTVLRRTQSWDQLDHYHASARSQEWYPRHLSFSIAEESVLSWRSIANGLTSSELDADDSTLTLRQKYAVQDSISSDHKRIRHRLAVLEALEAHWTGDAVQVVVSLDSQADADIQQLEEMYYPRLDEYQSLREDAHEIVSRERLQLQETIRDLETLNAKMEYEINTLRSKVDDVEDGVQELERQVEFVEERSRELEDIAREREGWIHWGFRIMTGIGRPPG